MNEHAHSSACLEDLKRSSKECFCQCLRVPLKPNALHGLKDKIMDLIVVLTFYSQRTGLNLVEGSYILHINVSYNLQLVLVWHCSVFKAQLFLPTFHLKSVFDFDHFSFEIKACDILKGNCFIL